MGDEDAGRDDLPHGDRVDPDRALTPGVDSRSDEALEETRPEPRLPQAPIEEVRCRKDEDAPVEKAVQEVHEPLFEENTTVWVVLTLRTTGPILGRRPGPACFRFPRKGVLDGNQGWDQRIRTHWTKRVSRVDSGRGDRYRRRQRRDRRQDSRASS